MQEMGKESARVLPACFTHPELINQPPSFDYTNPIEIWAAPSPFGCSRSKFSAPSGMSVADMVKFIGVDITQFVDAHVLIDGELVDRSKWWSTFPQAGSLVNIRAVPQGGGGGGKNPLRTLLTIAVFAAAAWAASAFAASLAGAMFGAAPTAFQLSIAGGLIKAGIGAIGSLLVNAIAPPSKPKLNDFSSGLDSQKNQSQTLFIQGARNQLVPFGVVPVVLGKHRMFPYQAGKPYTETVGDKQFCRQLFTWGFGDELVLSEEKIGETLLTAFSGVETYHVLDGNSAVSIPLYGTQPDQDDFSILLSFTGGYQLRTTPMGVDEINVDLTWPRGLTGFGDRGDRNQRQVGYQVEISPAGANTWTVHSFTLRLAQTTAVRRSHRFEVSNGQYDVRTKRNVADSTSDSIFDEFYWTALRTFTNGIPVLQDGIGLTALRIQATDQLNGVVDQYNAVVSNHILDWDADTQTWIKRETSNPASIFRYILQAPFNENALPDSRLDLPKIQLWHEYCESRGFEYNGIIDFKTTIDDVLSEVCAAGRASPSRPDGIRSVVIDMASDDVCQHFSPRKSWGYQLEKSFADIPHAFNVQFVNKEKGYIQDEIVVYADGYDAGNATKYQRLELSGICSAAEAYIHAREHLATVILRPEIHSFYCDIENLVAHRGDRIRLSHDVILAGLGFGRVKSYTAAAATRTTEDGDTRTTEDSETRTTEDNTIVTHVTLDETIEMEASKEYVLRFWMADGTDLLKPIVNVPGIHKTVEFVTPEPLETAPLGEDGEHFMFGELGSESLDLVIQDIIPGPDFTAQLRCVDYAPAIFEAATGAIPPFNSNISIPPEWSKPDAPQIKQIQTGEEVAIRNQDGSITTRMVITLRNSNTGLVDAELKIRQSGSDEFEPAHVVNSSPDRLIVEGLDDGKRYDLQVRYKRRSTGAGIISKNYSDAAIRSNVLFEGLSGDPDDVEDFRLQIVGTLGIFTWAAPTNIDHDHHEMRHTSALTGATWPTAQAVEGLEEIKGTNRVQIALQVGTYLIKAFDRLGNESQNATLIVTPVTSIGSFRGRLAATESPDFDGTLDNILVDVNRIVLDDPSLGSGTYTFDNAINHGGVFTSRITSNIIAAGENLSNTLDTWDSLAAQTNLSGSETSSWGLRLEYRLTLDDPGGSPAWTDWAVLVVGDYTFWQMEFRIVLVSYSSNQTPSVTTLEIVAEMEGRQVSFEDATIEVGGTTFPVDPAFYSILDVQVTGQDMNTGDYCRVTSKGVNGATVTFYDSSNTSIERVADVQLNGIGKVQE